MHPYSYTYHESHSINQVDQRIRERTYTSRRCGDDSFVRDAELAPGRILTPRKPGPKPKNSAAPENAYGQTTRSGSDARIIPCRFRWAEFGVCSQDTRFQLSRSHRLLDQI